MKVSDIFEMALSPEMEERKKKDQAKIKAERDASRRARPSRLRGRGRGTEGGINIKTAGNM